MQIFMVGFTALCALNSFLVTLIRIFYTGYHLAVEVHASGRSSRAGIFGFFGAPKPLRLEAHWLNNLVEFQAVGGDHFMSWTLPGLHQLLLHTKLHILIHIFHTMTVASKTFPHPLNCCLPPLFPLTPSALAPSPLLLLPPRLLAPTMSILLYN